MRRRGSALVRAAALCWLVQGPARAEAAPARWHFDFGKWRVSILFEREEGKGDTTRLLVKAPAGRFVFVSSQDRSGNDSTESVRRLPDGETLTRRLVLSSFEEIPSCGPVHRPDACVILTGRNGSLSAAISAFAGPRGAELRRKAEDLVSPAMRDALFALAPILPAVAEFGSYTGDFLALVWPDRFSQERALKRGVREKGCAFDSEFGFPCSAEEKAREAKRFLDAPR